MGGKNNIVEYRNFLDIKRQVGNALGFDPVYLPDCLFDFQKDMVEQAELFN